MSYNARYYDCMLRAGKLEESGVERDIKSLITATGGTLRTLAGPSHAYSAAAGQVPDGLGGVQVNTIPPVHASGYYGGPAYTNLFTTAPTAAEDKALTAQVYCLQCIGGSVVGGIYGTATPSAPLVFTPTAASHTFTPTGCTGWMLTTGSYAFPIIPHSQSVVSTVGTTTGNGIQVPLTESGVTKVPDGVEIIPDPTFSTWTDPTYPDGWVKQGTHNATNYFEASVNGLHFVSDGTLCYINKASSLTIGERYLVNIDTYSITGTSYTVSLGGTTADVVITTTGKRSIEITALGTELSIKRTFGIAVNAVIRSVSIQKLIPLQSQADSADRLIECFEGVPDGTELIPTAADREFTSNTGFYNLNYGTIGGGVYNITGVGSIGSVAYRASFGELGARYIITIKVDAVSGAGFDVRVGTAATPAITSPGTYKIESVCAGDTTLRIYALAAGITATIDNISIQKLNPAVGTVGVLMKMGVGSAEFAGGAQHNFLTVNAETNGLMLTRGIDAATSYVVRCNDITTVVQMIGTCNRNEYHMKFVEFGGGKFRVGNKRYTEAGVAIDADIVWSHATLAGGATFDGSFNPTTFLRWFLNPTVPNWMRVMFVSNLAGLGDTELLRRITKYGKF